MAARSGQGFHSYWGAFALATDLPNAAGATTQDPSLEAGDTAYVSGTSALYVCTTSTLGGAVWAELQSGGAGASTPRAAPVLVVGEEGYLQPQAAVASPPMPSNNANLDATPGAGEVLGVTCDYLDPGDGTQVEQAILAAAAAGISVDIRLRPMNVVFDPASVTLPLFLDDGCRLIGAGQNATFLTGGSASGDTTQQTFAMGEGAEIWSLSLRSPPPAFGANIPANSTPGVIANASSGSSGQNYVVRDCFLQLDVSNSQDRVENTMVLDTTGSCRVIDCDMQGGDGWTQPGQIEVVGIRWGTDSFSIAFTPTEPGFARGCRSSGFNSCAIIRNVLRTIIVSGWQARGLSQPQGAFRCRAAFAASSTFPGCIWSDLVVEMTNLPPATPFGERVAFFVDVDNSATLEGVQASNLIARMTSQFSNAVPSIGFRFRSDQTLRRCSMRGLTVTGQVSVGVQVETQGGFAFRRVQKVRIAEVNIENPTTSGAVGGRGCHFNASSGGTIEDCSILNSDVSGADTAGVEVTANCTNTQVGWNVLTPGAGAGIVDAGAATIAANNVP